MVDALDPRLASSRAKWERAKAGADQLVKEMREASEDKQPGVLETSRRYDPDSERVLFIAEKVVPEIIAGHWGLVIGEVIYNLRCALDHLWWALAIDHLGREPTPREARDVQFPILDKLDPAEWEGHRDLEFGEEEPSVGDIVLAVKVAPTGPAPDIDISPEIRGHIGFGTEAPVLLTLKDLGQLVFAIICDFASLLGPLPDRPSA